MFLVSVYCKSTWGLIIDARGLSCSFLNMPFNSTPTMCLSVCEPAKFELQEIKRGSIFMSRWLRRDLLCRHIRYGQRWRLL